VNIKKISIYVLSLLTIFAIAVLVFSAFNRLPQITSSETYKKLDIKNNAAIAWGPSGSQSIGLVGFGVNNQSGSQTPGPVASTIKILLALSVLAKKPLSLNQQGPIISINSTDVANYNADLALGQSVAKVQTGEIISEYQALQALLIASANNFAQILSTWAFGSTINYLNYANNYAKELGMSSTLISDASGYSTTTVSNSHDLAILGIHAINNPVIANIVDQYTAEIPVVGKIVNYNSNLNPSINAGIDGIKTGNTTAGGGNYIYSSNFMGYKIVGSITGASDLNTALSEGPKILNSYEKLIKVQRLVLQNQIVGSYNIPWLGSLNIYSPNNITLPIEPNVEYSSSIVIYPFNYGSSSDAGYIKVLVNNKISKYNLVYSKGYHSPSFWWRVKYSVKEFL
jgi:D-alanyl-D-alanine carboxypeptidase (penicillin-binding protein 5/6)